MAEVYALSIRRTRWWNASSTRSPVLADVRTTGTPDGPLASKFVLSLEVPEQQRELRAVEFHQLSVDLHSDGGLVFLGENRFDEAAHQTRLPDGRGAQHAHLCLYDGHAVAFNVGEKRVEAYEDAAKMMRG